jgi:hypothetical protein
VSFDHEEREVAKQMNVAQPVLAEARKNVLKEGVDWVHQGVKVLYSAAGIQRLLEVSGLAGEPSKFEKKTPAQVEARVLRKFPNPRVLEASLDGKKVLVRVSTSVNFIAGMAIPVRETETAGVYELARRCPRGYGRW